MTAPPGNGLPRHDALLRRQLLVLLDGGRAHLRARDVVRGFPKRRCGERPPGFAHSGWQLLEHLRIAQADIVGYATDPRHRSPSWPEGYWPKAPAPRRATQWDDAARAFLADLRSCLALVRDRRTDLFAPIPHAGGASWLQQLFLVAAHQSYHLGQLEQLAKVLRATAP